MRTILFFLLLLPSVVFAQGNPLNGVTVVHQGASPIAVLPLPLPGGLPGRGQRNSAGSSTGYSIVSSTVERAIPFGRTLGTSDTVVETRTQVVPNDMFGRPIRGGLIGLGQPNSAGWNTGYSAVTSTYERPDPVGQLFGGNTRPTVTESTTRIVPNDFWGDPIEPILPAWP